MTAKRMSAKYPGRCICGAPVQPGDEMLYSGGIAGCAACEFGEARARRESARRAEGLAKLLEKPFIVRYYYHTNAPGMYGWACTSTEFAAEVEAVAFAETLKSHRSCIEIKIDRLFNNSGEVGHDERRFWKPARK